MMESLSTRQTKQGGGNFTKKMLTISPIPLRFGQTIIGAVFNKYDESFLDMNLTGWFYKVDEDMLVKSDVNFQDYVDNLERLRG
jgi:hypothetical protein